MKHPDEIAARVSAAAYNRSIHVMDAVSYLKPNGEKLLTRSFGIAYATTDHQSLVKLFGVDEPVSTSAVSRATTDERTQLAAIEAARSGADTRLEKFLEAFRVSQNELLLHRALKYPRGCVVRVKGQIGTVVLDGECPADCIPVRFCNGNTWFKPLEEVHRAFPQSLTPAERQDALKAKGIKGLPMTKPSLPGGRPRAESGNKSERGAFAMELPDPPAKNSTS